MRGEQHGNPQLAFCQLAKPNPRNPVFVLGMEPDGLLKQTPFCAGPELLTHITLHHGERTIYNVTPKFSFVDLHIGTSVTILQQL